MSCLMEYYCCYSCPTFLSRMAALISLMLRCIFFPCYCFTSSHDHNRTLINDAVEAKARHFIAAQAVRDGLCVAAYSEDDSSVTCGVCLGEVLVEDSVWELRNCRHWFHRGCLDQWLDHDEHLTCPLCRAPLLDELPEFAPPPEEPSWAVERLLYLFGDEMEFEN